MGEMRERLGSCWRRTLDILSRLLAPAPGSPFGGKLLVSTDRWTSRSRPGIPRSGADVESPVELFGAPPLGRHAGQRLSVGTCSQRAERHPGLVLSIATPYLPSSSNRGAGLPRDDPQLEGRA